MKDMPDISRIAALIGDPARANMLVALMQGGALTVSELSAEAGVGYDIVACGATASGRFDYGAQIGAA